MKPNGSNISLTPYDDIFSTEQSRNGAAPEQIQKIPITELFPFKDHPFSVVDDKRMMEMVESVKEFGVMIPLIVRPLDGGGYEIISGHRRKHACELAELATMIWVLMSVSGMSKPIPMVIGG